MGCRTGFYFIPRDCMSGADVIGLTKDAFRFCASFEGEIPGATEVECGNWRDHDLAGAKAEAVMMLSVLEGKSETDLKYPTK